MYILTNSNCIVFSKLKFNDFLIDQFLYLFLYVYKLCQLVAYVLAVAPIIWVSRSITIYSKLLLSHSILFRNKHILILEFRKEGHQSVTRKSKYLTKYSSNLANFFLLCMGEYYLTSIR